MAQIISIRKMRQNKDPDVFINCVLNDPARLARVREKQIQAKEKARREAEEAERRERDREAFNSFVLKLSIGFSVLVTFMASLTVFLH